ncbi:hypothetical protein MKEN_00609100 [Mycena kentingensis (nom. inval.)]|nr:hypothetical protein MKEN_00609100 [Mycena kentingensis (nom. inval.)]
MAYNKTITPIPQPRALPLIGNLLDLQGDVPTEAMERILDVHGSIIKVILPAGKGEMTIVGGAELLEQMCDETRFFKLAGGALTALGGGKAQGLFTAKSEDEMDWQQAHRILLPAFGPLAMEEMFDEMHDIASQLVLKWARLGPNHPIHVTDDMTRLTLDTIALCSMDFRFNSFYSDTAHPFIQAMNHTLVAQSQGNQISGMLKSFLPSHRDQLRKDNELLNKTSLDLVQHRQNNPSDKKDLLNAMINGKDPKTGQSMRPELISANMTTFLIAGHETTSGLLSFAIAEMLLNPRTYFEARKEVDRVVGTSRLTVAHLRDLKYLNQVLRETLRLHPTAPAFRRGVRPDNKEEVVTITDRHGKHYEIPRGVSVLMLITKAQRDPLVWGPDCNEFVPERMSDANFEKLPKHAWKPFGTGVRACIGRAFAWQEALAVLALIFQNFDLRLADPNYEIKVLQSLTIKPKDLFVHASLREGITATTLQKRLEARDAESAEAAVAGQKTGEASKVGGGAPLTILFGSNTGTCQSLASRLASEAAKRGFSATTGDLDSGVGRLPRDHPVIIITASYEGQPPDNAARFVAWLESLDNTSEKLDGVKFAVFGAGNKDWATTFFRIPRLVDDLLAKHGAQRVAEMGTSDVSNRDVVGDFSGWTEGKIWAALNAGSALGSVAAPVAKIDVDVQPEGRAAHLQHKVEWAKVVDAKELGKPGSQKHHVEFELPEGMAYSPGDYLAVLPLNPPSSIQRVVKLFCLPPDGIITIRSSSSATLPHNKPLRITDLLQGYVELAQPATRSDLEALLPHTNDGAVKAELQTLLNDKAAFAKKVLDPRSSVLDIIGAYGMDKIALPFPVLLELLPPLQTRYYSISSSPLANARRVTLTYTVIEGTAWASGAGFVGVSGSYLRSLKVGDHALVGVRSTNKHFRLPVDPEKTPMVMICAGSGLAPFRGFVQERAVLMDEWAKLGAVEIRYAFSREDSAAKYVQDRMLLDQADVCELFEAGAKFYVCAGPKVAEGVRKAARTIVRNRAEKMGRSVTEEQISEWVKKMRNERFVSDVF